MMSIHHLEEMSSGCRERVSLHIRWNDARLVVHLDLSPLGTAVSPIENSFIERYNAACDAEDLDEAERLLDDILDAAVEAGRPIFDLLAPPPAPGATTSPDLQTLLFPIEYTFYFRTLDSKVELIRSDRHNEASLDPLGQPFHLTVDKAFNLPRFSTKDILVLENLLNNG